MINSDRMRRYSRVFRERSGARGAFEAELTELGITPDVITKVSHVTLPEDHVATEIFTGTGISHPREVIFRERRMMADGKPVQHATSYVPLSLAEGSAVESPDTGTGGTLSRLAELGREVSSHREFVRVGTAEEYPEQAAFLKTTRLLAVLHITYDAKGVPLSVDLIIMHGDIWSNEYGWQAS